LGVFEVKPYIEGDFSGRRGRVAGGWGVAKKGSSEFRVWGGESVPGIFESIPKRGSGQSREANVVAGAVVSSRHM
jgi:hypothetical protein